MDQRKIKVLGLLAVFFLHSLAASARSADLPSTLSARTATPHLGKQRILIFTDPNGGGHASASRAIEQSLGDEYELKVVTPLNHIPFISYYNKNQREGNMWALQLMTNIQPLAEIFAEHFDTRTVITSEILDFQPDLVMSVIPLVNRLTQAILEENHLNTSLLILPTDLKVNHFFNGMNNAPPSVTVSLPFNDESLRSPLRKTFSDIHFIALGFPLRPEFGFSPEEQQPKINAIREELGIKESDKTVLIMMGAQGVGTAITDYTQLIAQSGLGSEFEKIHVVALCGGNSKLKEAIEAIHTTTHAENPNVVIHPMGMKPGDYVAALMRLANVLVSKPGGGSVNEAFASELYTLYHTDRSYWPFRHELTLPWEAGNMEYSIKNHWGERINEEEGFLTQLERALKRPRIQIPVCEGRNFKSNLQHFVRNLLRPGVK